VAVLVVAEVGLADIVARVVLAGNASEVIALAATLGAVPTFDGVPVRYVGERADLHFPGAVGPPLGEVADRWTEVADAVLVVVPFIASFSWIVATDPVGTVVIGAGHDVLQTAPAGSG
jgi:hypothetical protein